MTANFPDPRFETPVLYFDGTCVLCNTFFKWVIKRDTKKLFLFATLQSEQGLALIKQRDLHLNEDTVLLSYHHEVLSYSSAALRTMILLGGWPSGLARLAFLVPKFIRDVVYRFIAKHRYQWFGSQECLIPNQELKQRFIA